MKHHITTLSVGLLLQTLSHGATTVTNYSGNIEAITLNENSILGNINVTDAVNGYFTFDPTAQVGSDRYDATISLSIGTNRFEISSDLNFIRARNNTSVSGLGSVDIFSHGFDSNGPTTELSPFYVYSLTVEFIDTTATIFDGSESLPVNLNTDDFDVIRWSLSGADLATRTDDFRVNGTISTVSQTVVPEPTSSALLLLSSTLALFKRNRP